MCPELEKVNLDDGAGDMTTEADTTASDAMDDLDDVDVSLVGRLMQIRLVVSV